MAIAERHFRRAFVPEVRGRFARGKIIKFLQHGMLRRSGSLEIVHLRGVSEESDLRRPLQIGDFYFWPIGRRRKMQIVAITVGSPCRF